MQTYEKYFLEIMSDLIYWQSFIIIQNYKYLHIIVENKLKLSYL